MVYLFFLLFLVPGVLYNTGQIFVQTIYCTLMNTRMKHNVIKMFWIVHRHCQFDSATLKDDGFQYNSFQVNLGMPRDLVLLF